MGYLGDQGLFGSWLFIAAVVVSLAFIVAHVIDLIILSYQEPAAPAPGEPQIFLAEENYVGMTPTNSYNQGEQL